MENVAELLQQLADADNEIAGINGQLKVAKQRYAEVEDRLFQFMDEQGTDRVSNREVGLQVSISETDVDTIEDWDEFAAFCLRKKWLHLFQRRLTSTAVAEAREMLGGKPIPGLGKFQKRRLHVTKYTK